MLIKRLACANIVEVRTHLSYVNIDITGILGFLHFQRENP